MAKLPGRKRRSRGAKRLDLSDLKHAVRDERQWVALGTVAKPDGVASHWELHTEEGEIVDVLVHVVTHPEGLDLTCRLGGMASNRGMLTIPAIGDEVLVALPSGQIAFQPTIVALLSTNSMPEDEGPAEDRTILIDAEVLVHDGTGGTKSLAFNEDLEALRSAYEGHFHQESTTIPTSPPMSTTPPVNPGAPPPYLAGTADASLGSFAGTQILRAK